MKRTHADLAIKYFMDDTDTIKIQFRKRDEDDWMDCGAFEKVKRRRT